MCSVEVHPQKTWPPKVLSSCRGAELRAGPLEGLGEETRGLSAQTSLTPIGYSPPLPQPLSFLASLFTWSKPLCGISVAHPCHSPDQLPREKNVFVQKVKSPNHPDNRYSTTVLQSGGSISCQPLLGNRKLSQHPYAMKGTVNGGTALWG